MPSVTPGSRPIYLDRDYSGVNPLNYVQGELHQVNSFSKVIVAPKYGRFYVHDCKVYALEQDADLVELNYGTDYLLAEYDPHLSYKTGREVYGAILILTEEIPGILALDYRAVGGATEVDTATTYQQVEEQLNATFTLTFSAIWNKPDTFQPRAHEHDVADVFGFDHIKIALQDFKDFLKNYRKPLAGQTIAEIDKPIHNALQGLKTTISNSVVTLQNVLSSHIAGTSHQHNWSKASVGLSNILNYGMTVGSTPELYLSPSTLKSTIDARGPAVVSPHVSAVGNVHNDTKETVGLGNVENLAVYNVYSYGAQAYNAHVLTPTQTRYVTAYFTHRVFEDYFVDIGLGTVTTELGLRNAPGGTVAQMNQAIATAQTQLATTQTTMTALAGAELALDSELQAMEEANRRFRMLHGREPHSDGLARLIQYDYSSRIGGNGGDMSLLFPLPQHIPNLYLWLDPDYAGNTIRTDQAGQMRMTAIHDRSIHSRIFVSSLIQNAPYFVLSQDTQDGNGYLTSNVLRFQPGLYMEQISGSSFSLQPGMTIFLALRNPASGVAFDVMTDSTGGTRSSMIAQGANNRAVSLRTDPNQWIPFLSPYESSKPSQSDVIVINIADDQEIYCWSASTKTLDSTYPRRANTPLTVWPNLEYLSAALSRLGSEDPSGNKGGELSQLIVYNRSLSFAETNAVIDYLRITEFNNQGLALDLSASNSF